MVGLFSGFFSGKYHIFRLKIASFQERVFIGKVQGANYNTSQVALYNTQQSFFERAMDLYNT